jgi:hypothetical protein
MHSLVVRILDGDFFPIVERLNGAVVKSFPVCMKACSVPEITPRQGIQLVATLPVPCAGGVTLRDQAKLLYAARAR